jgi:hypothetical protein
MMRFSDAEIVVSQKACRSLRRKHWHALMTVIICITVTPFDIFGMRIDPYCHGALPQDGHWAITELINILTSDHGSQLLLLFISQMPEMGIPTSVRFPVRVSFFLLPPGLNRPFIDAGLKNIKNALRYREFSHI